MDPGSEGKFGLQILSQVVMERGRDKETVQDLIDALKVFDVDHDGKLSVKDFKQAMMNMGERMNESEIDEIINDGDLVQNDLIVIEDFSKMIMNRI